jgi:transcriptional regulator with XRE-family HTH domain
MAMPQHQGLPSFGLGDRLRKAREYRGFTLEYMSQELTRLGREGSSSSSISDWERGSQPRHLENTVKLWAEITDFPVEWFYSQMWSKLTSVEMPQGQMELPLGDHAQRISAA